MKLIDRHAECGVLDGLLEAIRAGESRALVVSGEPGVGKTALLEYLAGQASECRLARIAGVQSEMELPFAALHQLCAPMLDKLPGLPVPQRDALEVAFGMSSGSAPQRCCWARVCFSPPGGIWSESTSRSPSSTRSPSRRRRSPSAATADSSDDGSDEVADDIRRGDRDSPEQQLTQRRPPHRLLGEPRSHSPRDQEADAAEQHAQPQ